MATAITFITSRFAPSTAPSLRRAMQRSLQRVEGAFDFAFGPRANPWRHRGAPSFPPWARTGRRPPKRVEIRHV